MTTIVANSEYVCGWSVEDDCSKLLQEADPAVAERCVTIAAEILYGLSGRQFGLCETTIRPCRRTENCGFSFGSTYFGQGYRWLPVLEGGQWYNVSCGRCRGDGCSCSRVHELHLPGPVNSVTQVLIDGVAQPLTNFRVDYRRTLVRLDGEDWPLCQDMNLASTEDNTYEVTYAKGRPLPVAGQEALAKFAVELCKACLSDKTCALPERVTSIVRQGISMTLLDPMAFINDGKTGLYLVDAWLHTVNPQGRPRSGGVFSPDLAYPRKTTWP